MNESPIYETCESQHITLMTDADWKFSMQFYSGNVERIAELSECSIDLVEAKVSAIEEIAKNMGCTVNQVMVKVKS